MAVLVSAVIVFITLISLIFGKQRNQALLGIEMVACLTIVYLFQEPVVRWL